MNSTIFKKILVGLTLIGTTGVAFHTSAHERYPAGQVYVRPAPARSYDYVYYPSHQVYFAPRARTWYWTDGGHWRSGLHLPFGININLGGVPIQLQSALPYYDHVYVEQRYGRPWRSTHHNRYGHRERRDYDDKYERRSERNGRDRYDNDRIDNNGRGEGRHRW